MDEKQRIEQDLRQQKALLKSLLDSTPDFIFYKNLEGIYLGCNRPFAELVNKKEQDIIGKTDYDLFDRKLADFFREQDRLMLKQGQPRRNDEWVTCPDGREVLLDTLKTPYRGPDGELIGLLGISRDLTERKQIEVELARSNDELEQFAYVISHDLRQPLRMISSYIQLLENHLDSHLDEDTRQMMHFAADGATRMNQMLVSLLEYSRVGRKSEPAEKLSTREILDEVLLFLRPAIDESGARIEISGNWPQLDVPRDEFTRLLQNLIDNAIKYRAAGQAPKITVEVTADDHEYRFCIADNGIGIDPEQQKRLFKVFQRLHTREQYQGTGIGLAFCRKIVEGSGGRIWIESPGSGSGSRFCFTLPMPTAAGVQA